MVLRYRPETVGFVNQKWPLRRRHRWANESQHTNRRFPAIRSSSGPTTLRKNNFLSNSCYSCFQLKFRSAGSFISLGISSSRYGKVVGHFNFDPGKLADSLLRAASPLVATEQDTSSIYGPFCSGSSAFHGVHQPLLDSEPNVHDVDTVFCLDDYRWVHKARSLIRR